MEYLDNTNFNPPNISSSVFSSISNRNSYGKIPLVNQKQILLDWINTINEPKCLLVSSLSDLSDGKVLIEILRHYLYEKNQKEILYDFFSQDLTSSTPIQKVKTTIDFFIKMNQQNEYTSSLFHFKQNSHKLFEEEQLMVEFLSLLRTIYENNSTENELPNVNEISNNHNNNNEDFQNDNDDNNINNNEEEFPVEDVENISEHEINLKKYGTSNNYNNYFNQIKTISTVNDNNNFINNSSNRNNSLGCSNEIVGNLISPHNNVGKLENNCNNSLNSFNIDTPHKQQEEGIPKYNFNKNILTQKRNNKEQQHIFQQIPPSNNNNQLFDDEDQVTIALDNSEFFLKNINNNFSNSNNSYIPPPQQNKLNKPKQNKQICATQELNYYNSKANKPIPKQKSFSNRNNSLRNNNKHLRNYSNENIFKTKQNTNLSKNSFLYDNQMEITHNSINIPSSTQITPRKRKQQLVHHRKMSYNSNTNLSFVSTITNDTSFSLTNDINKKNNKCIYTKKQKAIINMTRGFIPHSNQNKICTIEINDHRFTIAKFIKASDPILDINYNNIRKYNILSQLQEEITTKHNSQYHYIQKQTFPILNHTAREIPTAKQYSLTSKSTINQHNDINFSNKQFYTNRTVNASPLKPGKNNLSTSPSQKAIIPPTLVNQLNLQPQFKTTNDIEIIDDHCGVSPMIKLKIYKWLISIGILKERLISINELPNICINGVLLCDLINRCEGKNEAIKGIIRKTKTKSHIQVNINKVLDYLRGIEKFRCRHFWSGNEIAVGNKKVIWELLEDIMNFY